jgi:hypothetical protein
MRRPKAKAPGFPPTPSCGSALISRILCPRRLATPGCDHLSVRLSDQPAPACAVVRLLPGAIHPLRDLRPGGPFSCSVLHRMRFVVPPSSRLGRWALTPPFHPYPSFALASYGGRFVFCDTVCDRGLHRSPHAFTWHAALWCPDFPLASRLATKHQRSLRPTRRQSSGAHRNVQPQFPAAALNSFKSVCPSVY